MIASKYQPTGVKAVDLVAACVSHYRHFMSPLKTVYLKKSYWDCFRSWVDKQSWSEHQEEAIATQKKEYLFDGVEIKEGSKLMVGKELYVDFYPAQA